MKDKLHSFLKEDLLERYLLEQTNPLETEKVERYLSLYPEVRKEYELLQDNLELFVQQYTVKAPSHLKETILNQVKKTPEKKKNYYFLAVAACFGTLIFGAISFYFFKQNQLLEEKNFLANHKIRVMERDMMDKLEDLRNQYIVLNNPNTKRVKIQGNQKAENLKAVAYINPVKKLSYINMKNLPQLPENQCYQMWTMVNGELLNLGVIDQKEDPNKLLSLPYSEEAISYITIEPQGGNNTPSKDNIVVNFNY